MTDETDALLDDTFARALIGKQSAMLKQMRIALEECAEYFEPLVDVNWDGDGPNREASLLNEINYALGRTS